MKKQNKKLTISITNPELVVFEGEAESFSSVNIFGKFDVLPYHINFISIIKDVIVIHGLKGKEKEIIIDGGILRVQDDKINVLLGIELFKEEQKQLK